MAQPIWTTLAGTLDEIDEGVSYTKTLVATDSDGDPLTYSLIAGSLPAGLSLSSGGVISGTPTEVSLRTEKQFVIRVTDGTYSVDRTFKLFVDGSSAPSWVTASGSLGVVEDGEFFDVQLSVTDADTTSLFYSVVLGSLPPNISLDQSSGRLSGLVHLDSIYDSTNNRLWEFSIRVSDGISNSDRAFSIETQAVSDNLRASNGTIKADTTDYTADITTIRSLYWITDSGQIAEFKHNKYQITQVSAFDPDSVYGLGASNTLRYSLQSGSLPLGMSLESITGKIYGFVSSTDVAQTDYTFTIRVTKTTDGFVDQTIDRQFSIKIIGSSYEIFTWQTVDKELVI